MIDTQHPDFLKYNDEWTRCRDCADGQIQIHKKRVKYLPMLSEQSTEEYNAYLSRAMFYEATGRTIQGLKGMIFRKPPVIQQGGMELFNDDVDLNGTSLRSFCEKITEEILEVGRCGVLVDYPSIITEGLTVAQSELLNARPFFNLYKAESITNWRMGRINNKTSLLQVRLFEIVEEYDDFEVNEIEQYRVLDLNSGDYRQRVYRKNARKEWELSQEVYPEMNGTRMNYIPFVFFSPIGVEVDVCRPPLSGLVNVNLSHYLTTADLEHGAHFTGLPTAFVKGVSPDDENVYRIGSTTAWAFSNPDADAKYIEFTGQGLGALEKRIEIKEAMMASLGAQMLTPSTRRNESTDTASMRHMGENSILSAMSQGISEGLNYCLEIAGEWMGLTHATIELNRDFMPNPISPQMMAELFKAVQGGVISQETYFENLKEGEIIGSEKTFEDERAAIETNAVI